MARKCWEEKEGNSRKKRITSGCKDERGSDFEEKGLELEEIEKKRENVWRCHF